MKGYHSNNLTRHVQRYHPQNYESMSIELEQKAQLIKAENWKRIWERWKKENNIFFQQRATEGSLCRNDYH